MKDNMFQKIIWCEDNWKFEWFITKINIVVVYLKISSILMICFIGFLSDEFKFFNLKNPFYPSLQQWMQMDASTFEVTAVLSDIQTCTKGK